MLLAVEAVNKGIKKERKVLKPIMFITSLDLLMAEQFFCHYKWWKEMWLLVIIWYIQVES